MKGKDSRFLRGKTVLVYGATGGIGRAVAEEFHAAGARCIAGGRNPGALDGLARDLGLGQAPFCADFMDFEALERERVRIFGAASGPDVLVIAAGHDIRKPFHLMSAGEIRDTIGTNLTGVALLLRTFIPALMQRKNGNIAVVGGFGDGRLAFPCHAADAAARAGVRTLFEGIAREHPGSGIRFTYYCPSAVLTETEKPFLPLWRQVGVKLMSPQSAAAELARVLRAGKRWYMSGSAMERFGVRLNAAWPAMADALFMRGMGKAMNAFFHRRAAD